MALTITALDPADIPRGLLEPLTAKAVLRLNDVSTYLFTFDLTDPLATRLGPGWSLLVQDEGIRFSGAITGLTTIVDTTTKTLEVTGKDELHRLAGRLIYPDGSKEAWKQTLSHYARTQPAETLIRWLVDANTGPNTLPVRRSGNLRIGPGSGTGAGGSGAGPTLTIAERFTNLLETCQRIAATGNIVFTITREENRELVLRTSVSRNLTRQIRLEATGSIKTTAPTVNDILVAGQGEGAARTIVERTRTPAPWGHRIESFKDRRDTDERPVLIREGEAALDEGAARISASLTLTEAPGTVFGVDFGLGDRITLLLASTEVTEQVTSATITWDGHGRTIDLGVGPEGETPPFLYEKFRDLDARLRGLEKP